MYITLNHKARTGRADLLQIECAGNRRGQNCRTSSSLIPQAPQAESPQLHSWYLFRSASCQYIALHSAVKKRLLSNRGRRTGRQRNTLPPGTGECRLKDCVPVRILLATYAESSNDVTYIDDSRSLTTRRSRSSRVGVYVRPRGRLGRTRSGAQASSLPARHCPLPPRSPTPSCRVRTPRAPRSACAPRPALSQTA